MGEPQCGPYNPEYAGHLRKRLDNWCRTSLLTASVNSEEVCEVIIPAIDALAGLRNVAALPEMLQSIAGIVSLRPSMEDLVQVEGGDGGPLTRFWAAWDALTNGEVPQHG